MLQKIGKGEIFQAQGALIIAIFLQIVVWRANHDFAQSQFFIILAELALLTVISFSSAVRTFESRSLHRFSAISLLLLMSVANATSLIIIINSLISGGFNEGGLQLLASALAIFITNIIVYALWYWEIDSPGLTRRRWSSREKDFQFTQQDMLKEFPNWKPKFFDYLYLSLTNAINFASADAKPLTQPSKFLMGSQAIISVFTLALVLSRSVTILGS